MNQGRQANHFEDLFSQKAMIFHLTWMNWSHPSLHDLRKQINHGQALEELWDLNRFLLRGPVEEIEVLMRFAHLAGKLRKCP